MHVLFAGNSLRLQREFEALRADLTDLCVVQHVRTEGELFLELRRNRPDLVLLEQTIRPEMTVAWFEYLHRLSPRSRLILVDPDDLHAAEAGANQH